MDGFWCQGVTKRVGDFGLKDISFAVEPGTVMGLVGCNGSGKTTLIRTILGALRLAEDGDTGSFGLSERRDGEALPPGGMLTIQELRRRTAFVMSSFPFPLTQYPIEIGEMYGPYYEGFDIGRYREFLAEYHIPGNHTFWKMSAGEGLKIQLAFALSCDATLYVMDEPEGNLDVEFRDEFYRILRQLVSDGKRMVILSSHLITELEHIADTILWLRRSGNESRVFFYGTVDELRESCRMLEAESGVIGKLPPGLVVGTRTGIGHSEALLRGERADFDSLAGEIRSKLRFANLREIMYYVEKSGTTV